MEQSRTSRNKQSNRWKRNIKYVLLFLLIIFISVGSYLIYEVYTAANKSYQELERADNKSDLRKEAITFSDDPISMLLIGVENYSTGGKDGRADTQIVVTLNPETKKVTMTSIPRDTRVKIDEIEAYSGYHKINAAYSFGSLSGYGGSKLTVEKVEELLNIPIDKYVAVDFDGFRDIIDTLGGVTVDVKEGFWEENIYQNNERIYFEEGPTHLNGEEALAFVRMRRLAVNYTYPREERQRQLIRAAIKETISAGTIFKANEISTILGKNIETNLKPKEIYHLERSYSSIGEDEMETIHIEGTNQRVEGLSFFIPNEDNLNDVSEQLKQQLELTNPQKSIPTIEEKFDQIYKEVNQS
ncbi:LCP family protein [Aquibacillus albus]|uniref:LCP family protein required for cell wall assembly n=1 Tax=Aquibacillus albus TaxID=1168171 RepID=A0ABS2N326_9BACI|nr:LCP family protein [Aquibacillus albus]MBM7572489.1 LCP family protein required for cell wall assembly [Aquibacillus albus]